MNKKIFFNIVIQLLTFIRYGLIALTGLIMLALLILLIDGKPIQNSLQLDVPLPIIVIILIISILLVACFIYMATILKKLIINFQKGAIFSTENVVYTKIILGTLIVWTGIQFASAFFLSYLDLENVSDLYDFSLSDYFINGVLIIIALLAKMVLEKGVLLQAENDEII
ncbi:TPA: DUF2975 domain-containing protein [Streptococcus suis]|uniref:DUF2975 domain-containing protein n=1 Tax=Streptococcus suis TaxID=1307 RepID=A0A0Z8J2K5_STRSU|nr:DUF2975 domain-containing protein [Streptococcus suis]MCQ8271921.1 DUF2975 domain-containing protein [Streptococcus suis]MCQ8786241.1 DUF2975 domain-containing protein [Streptococcus suis]MDW8721032.1 DUF2975 domain-containing protein [Streptococcus suis]MDY7595945.1 DUF2975 domain-containing protein [Streptococcus suis]MDY7600569.1 DUF2975 domain-containing protein [Streptococcus suis]